MSFLSRLKKIIKSNIYTTTENTDLPNYDTAEKQENSQAENNKKEFATNSVMPDAEYYAILEIPDGSDFETIKNAYRRLLKKYHPDLYHNDSKKYRTAEKLIEKINEAYSYFEEKHK